MPATEKAITKNIQAWLKQQPGVFFYKVHGDPFQTAGLPDLIICSDGWFIGLEVKRPGGKPTPLQTRTIQRINEAGGHAEIVTSVDEAKAVVELYLALPEMVASRKAEQKSLRG